jgi:hypothetical protein
MCLRFSQIPFRRLEQDFAGNAMDLGTRLAATVHAFLETLSALSSARHAQGKASCRKPANSGNAASFCCVRALSLLERSG